MKKVARELLTKIKQQLVLDWRKRASACSKVKVTIEDILDGLPGAYSTALYQQKCAALFEHIYESYPERDKSVYQTAG